MATDSNTQPALTLGGGIVVIVLTGRNLWVAYREGEFYQLSFLWTLIFSLVSTGVMVRAKVGVTREATKGRNELRFFVGTKVVVMT